MTNAENPNLGDLKKLLRRLEKIETDPSAPAAAAGADAAPAGHALKLQKAILDEPANDVRPDEALARLHQPASRERRDGSEAPDFPVIVKPDWPVRDTEEPPPTNKDIVRTVIIASLTAAFVSALATGAVLVWMGGLQPQTASEQPVFENDKARPAAVESMPSAATAPAAETELSASTTQPANQDQATERAAEKQPEGESVAAVLSPPAAMLSPLTDENSKPEPATAGEPSTTPETPGEQDAQQATEANEKAGAKDNEIEPPRPQLAAQTDARSQEQPAAAMPEEQTVSVSEAASSEPQAEAASQEAASQNEASATESASRFAGGSPSADLATDLLESQNSASKPSMPTTIAANSGVDFSAPAEMSVAPAAEPQKQTFQPTAELVSADKVHPSETAVEAQQVVNTVAVSAREVPQPEKTAETPVKWNTAGILSYAPVTIIKTGEPVDLPIAIAPQSQGGSASAGARSGSYLILSGLKRGTHLSKGTELMFDTWRVPVSNLGNLAITVPPGFARRIQVHAELRAEDGTTLERFTLALEAPDARSIKFAGDSADSAKLSKGVRSFVDIGEVEVDNGNLAAARLYFERAANEGSGRAAMLLAASFDPSNAKLFKADSTAPSDLEKAREWYGRAAKLGVEGAAERQSGLSR